MSAPSWDVAKWGLDRDGEGGRGTCRVCAAGPNMWCDRVAHRQARIRRAQEAIENDGLAGVGHRPTAITVASHLGVKLDAAERDQLIAAAREMDRADHVQAAEKQGALFVAAEATSATIAARTAAAAPYVAAGTAVEQRRIDRDRLARDSAAARRMERGHARRVERAEQRTAMEAGAAIERDRRARRGAPAPAHPDAKAVEALLPMLSGAIARPLAVERRDRDRALTIVQRCRACRGEIVGRIGDSTLTAADWQAQIGHLVRHSYLVHRCAAVRSELHQARDEELQELLESTEHDMNRIGERIKAIEAEMDRRSNERTTKP